MLQIADGLRLTEVRNVVTALRRMRYRKSKAKGARSAPFAVKPWAALPWGTMITGFALAEKRSGRAGTGELCLRLYVRRKVAQSRLGDGEGIPGRIEVRRGNDRFVLVTDVEEGAGDPVAQRVAGAGATIGSFTGITEGTLGLAVADKNGQEYALTCSHVAAPWFRDPQGDAIESPPDADGQAGVNTIGNVATWTQLVPDRLHLCDAALIKPATGVTLTNDALRLAETNPMGDLTLGEFVAGVGVRVETFTRRKVVRGTVTGMHNHHTIAMMGDRFHFQDVVEVTYDEETTGGDSGSAVVQSETRQVLGLHFAALGRTGYFVTAKSIRQVFSSLDLRPV